MPCEGEQNDSIRPSTLRARASLHPGPRYIPGGLTDAGLSTTRPGPSIQITREMCISGIPVNHVACNLSGSNVTLFAGHQHSICAYRFSGTHYLFILYCYLCICYSMFDHGTIMYELLCSMARFCKSLAHFLNGNF